MFNFCSLCSLSVSISLLGYAPSFLGQIFYDMIIVAPSLSSLNMLKSCCLVLLPWRKTQKTKKKKPAVEKILYLISLQQKTLEHTSNRFRKLQHRATTFIFFDHFWKLIMWPPSQWAVGWTLICIIILILVSSPFGNPQWYVFFWIYTLEWTLKAVPDILYTIPIFSDFSPNFPAIFH